MDPSPLRTTPIEEDDDNWDTDRFVIPSFEIEVANETNLPKLGDSKSLNGRAEKEEELYLRPHKAPPSQAKQQEHNSLTRKQMFKQKLKAADKRHSGGLKRENKVDSLRDIVGDEKFPVSLSNHSPRDWLDPHCHESEFERRNH